MDSIRTILAMVSLAIILSILSAPIQAQDSSTAPVLSGLEGGDIGAVDVNEPHCRSAAR